MAAGQRIQQGIRALFAFTQPVAFDLAAQYLAPELLNCFRQMRRSEQLHSLNVLRSVLAQGSTPDDLAVAALLHDVGKSRQPFSVLDKTLVVLVRAGYRPLFDRWSQGDPRRFWQRPFVVSHQHPAWGADMLAALGAAPRVLWLVRHHADALQTWADHPDLHLLKRLKQADDAN